MSNVCPTITRKNPNKIYNFQNIILYPRPPSANSGHFWRAPLLTFQDYTTDLAFCSAVTLY
jgi:hypothetical protein